MQNTPSDASRDAATSASTGLSVAPVAVRGRQMHVLERRLQRRKHAGLRRRAGRVKGIELPAGSSSAVPSAAAAAAGKEDAYLGGSGADSSASPAASHRGGLGVRQQTMQQEQMQRFVRTASNSPPIGCPFKNGARSRHVPTAGAAGAGCPLMQGSGVGSATAPFTTAAVAAADGFGSADEGSSRVNGYDARRSVIGLPVSQAAAVPRPPSEERKLRLV